MPTLTLCCFPGACSRATMIALEEAGVPYSTRVVNLRGGGQNDPDYRAINPKGKVPALLADGTALTENVAILAYLADVVPQANLLPPTSDPLPRAQALSAIGWLSSAVLPLFSRIMRPERVCDLPGAAERMATMAKEEIRSNLTIAERHMQGREWWIHQWSVADAYLFYITMNAARQQIELAAFPSLEAHAERMKGRPATQRVLAWDDQAMAQMQAA